ncbi:MAG: succinylglutamate desuccinylase/aspartoacylase family protein [Chloroflexi bacterium]|nr:succinylglutamate desuccinylase/aspartoacylase family protein [Chloroflexota bacterium]
MLRVGNVSAMAGEKTFGYLETTTTRSGLKLDIPVHLVAGAEPGPTLMMQGAVHGGEIIGTLALLNFVEKANPTVMRGNVIVVPVVNRAGFELGERMSRVDNKDISQLFPGNKNGSASDVMAYVYFQEAFIQSDVFIDFHAGGRTAYERYVLFDAEDDPANLTIHEERRRKLVVAYGLDQAAFFPAGTFSPSFAKVALEDVGTTMITIEFGGGTGWYENGDDNVRDAERGIWNILKSMRIIDGEFESDGPLCTVYNAGVVIWKPPVDGLFIRDRKFRDELKEGDVYGRLVDPYTGALLAAMPTPDDGIVIPSGQEWPTVGATSIGILGSIDRIEDRRSMDLYLDFD